MRIHNPQYARSEYHTQLAKIIFDKIFDLTAGVYFDFYNIQLRQRGNEHGYVTRIDTSTHNEEIPNATDRLISDWPDFVYYRDSARRRR